MSTDRSAPRRLWRRMEYEETFLLDRCFGDHVLDTMLDLGNRVWTDPS